MRLSADLLSESEQHTNSLGEREIILRNLAIPAIEHLGTTRDAFDSIDLTDNRLVRLDNFPRLHRLSHLVLSNNTIESIDGKNFKKNVPNLKYLTLSYNKISKLNEIANIAEGCPNLIFLTLTNNPVVRRQYYRLFTIHRIPTLEVLDFTKIKQSERDKAKRLSLSAAGAALESDVQMEAREAAIPTVSMNDVNTFVPGGGNSTKESFLTNFTPQQKNQIHQMITNAKSPSEVERIEFYVKRGQFPSFSAENGTNIPNMDMNVQEKTNAS